jgi:mannose-1-phosphate guanylyltransferase
VEKPPVETAIEYIKSGRYYWNSGMFIWSAASVQKAFAKHHPVLAGLIDRLAAVAGKPAFDGELAGAYGALKKISIDYALMEKADNIVMAAGLFPWDDVGAWPALVNHFPPDEQGNTLIGACEPCEASGNIVYSKGHLTALLGVKDLIVVQADGVTLVCSKDRAQDIKKLLAQLRQKKSYEAVL